MNSIEELLNRIVSDKKLRTSLSEAAKAGTADSFLKSQNIGVQELTDDETAAATGGAAIISAPPKRIVPFGCRRPTPCSGMTHFFYQNPKNRSESYFICDVCSSVHRVTERGDGSVDIKVIPFK